MTSHDLTRLLEDDTPVREFVLFGTYGEFVNMTDGRYMYMRRSDTEVCQYEYTLMPTHMRTRFSVEELKGLALSEPFSFTKEVPLLKIPCGQVMGINLDVFETVLYDLETDPGQQRPVSDLEKELEFINRLRLLMAENDAYIKLKSLFRLMPKEQREQLEAGLKQMLRTTGAKEICSETVLAFVENLSIEEGQKNMLLGMIG